MTWVIDASPVVANDGPRNAKAWDTVMRLYDGTWVPTEKLKPQDYAARVSWWAKHKMVPAKCGVPHGLDVENVERLQRERPSTESQYYKRWLGEEKKRASR